MYNDNEKAFVEKIRNEYTKKEISELDNLKALDKKVHRPAEIFALCFGIVGAIIMGSGMSLIMTDIGEALKIAEPLYPGIAVGVAGLIMCVVNYPIYKAVLSSRKKKYADEILAISDKFINN